MLLVLNFHVRPMYMVTHGLIVILGCCSTNQHMCMHSHYQVFLCITSRKGFISFCMCYPYYAYCTYHAFYAPYFCPSINV
jgi:hypothetical protein